MAEDYHLEDFLGLISLDMYNFIQKLIKAHAEYEKENECCGLIGLNNLKEIQVVPCENTHITREKILKYRQNLL